MDHFDQLTLLPENIYKVTSSAFILLKRYYENR